MQARWRALGVASALVGLIGIVLTISGSVMIAGDLDAPWRSWSVAGLFLLLWFSVAWLAFVRARAVHREQQNLQGQAKEAHDERVRRLSWLAGGIAAAVTPLGLSLGRTYSDSGFADILSGGVFALATGVLVHKSLLHRGAVRRSRVDY